MASVTFNTINTVSIWKALNAPGQPVSDYTEKISKKVMRLAIAGSPVNHPENAMRPGHHPPGLYKASWRHVPARSNSLSQVAFAVTNLANHAMVVEKGKPYVRKRQVFTWQHARESRLLKSGRYGYRKAPPGFLVSTKVVHAWGYPSRANPSPAPRRGHRVLEKAASTVAKQEGLRRSASLTF